MQYTLSIKLSDLEVADTTKKMYFTHRMQKLYQETSLYAYAIARADDYANS